jgi:hypothetical protein
MKAKVGSLESRINTKQEEIRARVRAIQYKMEVKIKCSQEETETAIHYVRSELEETIKHRVEDVLACVDKRTQGLCKELNEKIEETQENLQTVKTSIDTWTGSLKVNITEAKKDFYEAKANTRNDLMLQVETQTTKALIEASLREFQAQLEEAKSVIHVTIY